MKSHLGVGFIALSTAFFAIALYSVAESVSSDRAFVVGMTMALAWAIGAVVASIVGKDLRHSGRLQVSGVVVLALAQMVLAFVSPIGLSAIVVTAGVGICAGFLLVTMVCSHLELHRQAEPMREAFVAFLGGKGAGFLFGAVMVAIVDAAHRTSLFSISAALVLVPLAAGRLSEAVETRSRAVRGIAGGLIFVALLLLVSPAKTELSTTVEKTEASAVDLVRAPYLVRPGRGLHVLLAGMASAEAVKSHLESGARGVMAVVNGEHLPAGYFDLKAGEGVELSVSSGSGRRRLESEARRFDLIQVFLESESKAGKSMEQTQGLLTVEAFRLYLDHLKQDGMLQLVPPAEGLTGKRAQAVLATLSEAWKRSGRKDVDLHSLVVGHLSTSEVDVLVVTLKDVLKEERDHLGGFFRVGQNERGWVLPSDSSGPVMTDDKPFLKEMAPGGLEGWLLGAASATVLIALIAWITAKERRKGVASQWQTFSIAIFFGGLGLSFALFSTFFEMRAMRDWGRPELASALVVAALSVFSALGAQLFAGHPKRRFGVRIQPLANFVFAALFAYLAGAVAEPLVASGGEIFSILIGASVLIPYGLLGGPFFPNAMEEAAEKLHPKSMYLLWASFAAGASLGLYVGTSLSVSAGFSAVFLAGVFVFAWVAIIGGLVRPFSLRKAGEGA
ncbi:MAG: hypothetical protein IPJ84_11555 [Bdellovibrionales bacterium]|nr:hypothetical protein [Bdellovibrionales bacterium]